MTDSATSNQLLRRGGPRSRNLGKLEEVDQEKVKLMVDPALLPVTVGLSHLYACHADRQPDFLLFTCHLYASHVDRQPDFLLFTGQMTSSSHFAPAFRDTETTSFAVCFARRCIVPLPRM